MTPVSATWMLLVLFAFSWMGAALWAGQTVAAARSREQVSLYAAGVLFLLVLGVATTFAPGFRERLWPRAQVFDWTMVAVCLGGFAWCWWARLHIGPLWSGGVAVKEDHRVVDTGPYAVVRHPIYTGAFAAVLACAAIRARPADLLFFAGFLTFFAFKARLEERFLAEQFGPAYDDYRARVPMLIPRPWLLRTAAAPRL